ncbi:MAG: DUF2809 domain-containing protein [Pseudomonadales bacterium]
MALGLLSRSELLTLPNVVATYAGDALWALMVFWGVRFLFPAQAIVISACLALSFAFAIEVSQLYHAPWIDAIRNTKIGGLILGFGFKFSDLVCYTIGVAIGAFINLCLLRRQRDVRT